MDNKPKMKKDLAVTGVDTEDKTVMMVCSDDVFEEIEEYMTNVISLNGDKKIAYIDPRYDFEEVLEVIRDIEAREVVDV